MQEIPRTAVARLGSGLAVVVALSFIVMGVFFARRNIRLGRGDRKGAFRLFVFVLSAGLLAWLLRAHHVADLRGEFSLVTSAIGKALFDAGLGWLLYMALEPYVRRRWPDLLISWNRLLSGRFRNPLVGRDVLIGSLLSAASAVNLFVEEALLYFFDIPGETPWFQNSLTLRGPRHLLSVLFDSQVNSVGFTVVFLSLLFLAHLVVRRKLPAVLATGLVMTLIGAAVGGGENALLELPFSAISVTLMLVALLRFGAVAFALAAFIGDVLTVQPSTLDFSRWYAGHGLFFVAIFLAALAYGFKASLGGRPMFGATLDE